MAGAAVDDPNPDDQGTSAGIDLNHFAPWGTARSMYIILCRELREIEDFASRRHTSQETAMAKAKKRIVARKKSSKRGKASAKPARRKAAKRTTPKKAKSKVRRAIRGAAKPMAKKQRPSKMAARKASRKPVRQVVEVPVEDTIIDVIEEPVPGVVVVTEYETIRTVAPVSSRPEPNRAVGPETEEQ